MTEQPSKFGVYTLNGKFVVKNNMVATDTIVRYDGKPADSALQEDMRFFGMCLADAQALAQDLSAAHTF